MMLLTAMGEGGDEGKRQEPSKKGKEKRIKNDGAKGRWGEFVIGDFVMVSKFRATPFKGFRVHDGAKGRMGDGASS
jgi:hypothetical protein